MKLLRMSNAGWLRLATFVFLAGGINAGAAPWAAKTPRLATPWTWQVPVENPLPEYPRPKLTRPEWQSLNGIWDFAVMGLEAGQPGEWPEQIRVPFPVESALSGIQRAVTPNDKLWYRRTFLVPDAWQGRRVQLNFGASDWQTTVWVNNQQVGSTHTGGYDGFGYDITDSLNGGINTIVASVYDPTDAGQGAVGKQRLYPGGIFYTAASGIWQTVWIEPTPGPHPTRLDITPDLSSNSRVSWRMLRRAMCRQACHEAAGQLIHPRSVGSGSRFGVWQGESNPPDFFQRGHLVRHRKV